MRKLIHLFLKEYSESPTIKGVLVRENVRKLDLFIIWQREFYTVHLWVFFVFFFLRAGKFIGEKEGRTGNRTSSWEIGRFPNGLPHLWILQRHWRKFTAPPFINRGLAVLHSVVSPSPRSSRPFCIQQQPGLMALVSPGLCGPGCASYLVVKSCSREHHGHLISPLRLVFPLIHLMVPEMQAARVAHQPIRKFPPDLRTEAQPQSAPAQMTRRDSAVTSSSPLRPSNGSSANVWRQTPSLGSSKTSCMCLGILNTVAA